MLEMIGITYIPTKYLTKIWLIVLHLMIMLCQFILFSPPMVFIYGKQIWIGFANGQMRDHKVN